jgi:hypothetical protein
VVRERFFTLRLRVTSYDELPGSWTAASPTPRVHKHPEIADCTVWQVFEAERAQLVPIGSPFDGFHATQASAETS